MQPIRLLFTEPPGPASHFIEAEDIDGHGVNCGEWSQQGPYWVLTILADAPIARLEGEPEDAFNARKGRIEAAANEMRKARQPTDRDIAAEAKAATVWR